MADTSFSAPSRTPSRPRTTAAVAISGLALIVLLQWSHGAYQAEFGAHPDEAAHYVTGLMVHDYIAAGLPRHAMAFAQDYYDHYPKVALLNWPPGFYVLQAAWTLPFSPSRPSVLLLMAVITCIVAVLVVRALLPEVGLTYALLGGAVFIAIPLVQQYSAMVMTEMPITLFSFLATLSFARYLERGWTRDSVLFGLFASAAIMTKGSGLALGLVPPLAIVFTGRIELVKRLNFWYPAVLVALLCGPWTWLFRNIASAGWDDHVSLHYTWRAVTHFPKEVFIATSVIISVVAVVGFLVTLIAIRRGQASALWVAVTAQVIGVVAFHSVVPASLDSRNLIPALPGWAMFGAAGVLFASNKLVAARPRLRWVPVSVALVGLVHTAWLAPGKRCGGFGAVVADALNRQENSSAVFLISSDATGEGMFIAEAALHEKRPGHTIRRASKVLSSQRWDGGDYQIKVDNEPDLVALLERERIRFVVIDRSIPKSLIAPHHRLLRAAVEHAPELFTLRHTYPVTRDYLVKRPGLVVPDGISVYELDYDAVTATVNASSRRAATSGAVATQGHPSEEVQKLPQWMK